jgi:1-acyl-sn-glycerol-3-phosphate acyltransferase
MRDAVGSADERWLRFMTAGLLVQARYHRFRTEGLEKIPDGPALLVANHNGGAATLDALFVARYYAERGYDRPIYMLGHEFMFKRLRLYGPLARFGLVPADKRVAAQLLERGEKVLVFPGSDLDSMRPYSARAEVWFGGRRGFARTALNAGVPIVPIASAGAHEGFIVLAQGKRLAQALGWKRHLRWDSLPVALSVPWGLTVGPASYLPYLALPSQITVRVCDPIETRSIVGRSNLERIDAIYDATLGALRAAVADLYRARRYPIIG